MQFPAAFEKAFGRPPTPAELERVKRVQDAFGVGDNDALMTIAGLLVFYDSGALEHLRQGARLYRAALRESTPHGSRDAQWRAAIIAGCLWAASTAFVAGLALAAGAGMTGGHPCWVPSAAVDQVAVAVLGAPTGWLVLLAMAVPGGFAGIWCVVRGSDERHAGAARWMAWTACAGLSVALLTLLALVLVKVPHG